MLGLAPSAQVHSLPDTDNLQLIAKNDCDRTAPQTMYRSVFLTAVVLCTCYTVALGLQNVAKSSSQTILKNAGYHFRQAIKEDIDDITTVCLDAFSPGPAFQYIMPEYQKWKDYTWHCLQASLEQQWDDLDTDTIFIQVVAVPDTNASNGRHERVVAFGIWVLKERDETVTSTNKHSFPILQTGIRKWESQLDTSNTSSKYNCSANLNTNETRTADYERQLDAKSRFLDQAYPKQLYLNTLATHPDWDGYGFAAMNLHWGFELANTSKIPVTLIATPAGYPLYDDIGFRSIKNITIETLDGWGEGFLWFEAMDHL